MYKQQAYELGYQVGMMKEAGWREGLIDTVRKRVEAAKQQGSMLTGGALGGVGGAGIGLLLKHILETKKEKEKSSYIPWLLGGGLSGAGLGSLYGMRS